MSRSAGHTPLAGRRKSLGPHPPAKSACRNDLPSAEAKGWMVYPSPQVEHTRPLRESTHHISSQLLSTVIHRESSLISGIFVEFGRKSHEWCNPSWIRRRSCPSHCPTFRSRSVHL